MSSLPAAHVQSVCDTMEIPHIETRWDFHENRDFFSVNMYPHYLSMSKAYVDYVKHLQWTSFIILYEHDEGMCIVFYPCACFYFNTAVLPSERRHYHVNISPLPVNVLPFERRHYHVNISPLAVNVLPSERRHYHVNISPLAVNVLPSERRHYHVNISPLAVNVLPSERRHY